MQTILGLVMFYSWIHGAVIVFKKVSKTTSYENSVLIFGLVTIILFIIGSL